MDLSGLQLPAGVCSISGRHETKAGDYVVEEVQVASLRCVGVAVLYL